jgi:UDP-N-acetylmuramyl pentapeptide phosphotransferase/UDP-N-acetylglucosamine-1-phosphate transferase
MNDLLLFGVMLLFALLLAVTLEMMVLPRIIYIAKKKNIYDIPCARKSHRNPIPRLAGISFFPVLLFVFSVCALIYSYCASPDSIGIYEPALKRLLGLITGNLLILGIGIKDDIVGVRYKHKMIIQFLAAVLLVASGLYINDFNGLFGIHEVSFWIGVPFTVLLAMFIMNAINLIDGADGLASGISGVALISFAILFLIRGMFFYTLICTILVGILIPFFYYNVFYPSRKIFMGDTGSLTLGFLLAYLGVRFAMNTPENNYEQFRAPVMIALSAMFIPIFDALRVMLGRALEGKSMFLPDRRHIHHKLLDLGFSHRKVMVSLVLCACLFVLINVALLSILDLNIIFALDIILWMGLVKILNEKLKLVHEYGEKVGQPVRIKKQ